MQPSIGLIEFKRFRNPINGKMEFELIYKGSTNDVKKYKQLREKNNNEIYKHTFIKGNIGIKKIKYYNN